MSLRLIIVGNPGCRRVAFWQQAATRLDWPPPRFVSYVDLIAGRSDLRDYGSADCLLRFEPAADNWTTFKLLLKHGAKAACQEGYPALDVSDIDALQYERGWLIRPLQAYLGFVRLLKTLEAQAIDGQMTLLHGAADIADCFDKRRCQKRLAEASLPVPKYHRSLHSYEELRPLVLAEGRIMLKLAHGSGGAGCIAMHGHDQRVRAITTVVEIKCGGETRLFQSKRVRHVTDETEIAALVKALCVEKVHIEAWLPKAQWDGRNIDIRVVTIGGRPRHVMVRASHSVFTNLTLGSGRGDRTLVAERMGSLAWQQLLDTAAGAARAFPQSFTLGIDLLVRPDWRHHAVLEVNAFGDLLLGQLDHGEDTYTATLRTWEQGNRRMMAEVMS